MKIRYNINNLLVNNYFDDERLDYSKNQEYQEMKNNGNYIEIKNTDFIRFEYAKVVIVKKQKVYTEITQEENDLLQKELIPIEQQIQNKKNELTIKRKNLLKQNKDIFIKMFRDFLLTIANSQNPAEEIINIADQNKDFCKKDKTAEDEVAQIENATSLEELIKFE